ncbi:MAG: hypothetical protein M3R02_29815 [Chloroflexota bacterium]|nr:hypothetical protein [Chloroflexota bacterium]
MTDLGLACAMGDTDSMAVIVTTRAGEGKRLERKAAMQVLALPVLRDRPSRSLIEATCLSAWSIHET